MSRKMHTDTPALRVSVYLEGKRRSMRAISISNEATLRDVVCAAAKALGSQTTYMCLESGARIDDIAFIRDGDILMLARPPVESKGRLIYMDETQSYYCNVLLPLPLYDGLLHRSCYMIYVQRGQTPVYQELLLPSPLNHEGQPGGHTQISRRPLLITANQDWVVWKQNPLSPMVVEVGGVPRVTKPPQSRIIPHARVNGHTLNDNNRNGTSNYPNDTNVSNARNQSPRSQLTSTTSGRTEPITPFVHGLPNIESRVHRLPKGTAATHSGMKRTVSMEDEKAPKGSKRRKSGTQKDCDWCGSLCVDGLPRHIQEKCEDGLFRAVCDAIRLKPQFRKSRVTKGAIKMEHNEVKNSRVLKSQLTDRVKKHMTDRIKERIKHTVWAPRRNASGYRAFQGLDAMIYVFFRLFDLEMPVAVGLKSYNFTGFDAEIGEKVKQLILKWMRMTRKRDVPHALDRTSQDSEQLGDCKLVIDMSKEDWNILGDMEYEFLHDETDLLKDIRFTVERFTTRLLRVAPTVKFAWLRCFLVSFREFSAQALELKSLPNGQVRYRTLESAEGKSVLISMSTFVKQTYKTLKKSFRDVIESEDHATELRLQLLRAILAMPSNKHASRLMTLAEDLVMRLSKDIHDRFSSQFGDVPQITQPSFIFPTKSLSITESAQKDLCHFVHVRGSLSSRMCLDKSTLKPILDGQNGLHSTALDLLINHGLNSKVVSSLPDFINSQTLRITSNKRWKDVSLETKYNSRFAKLDALIITKCAISKLEIGTLKRFRHLRCLRLVGNDISSLQLGVFDHLTRLEILDLSFNRLGSIPSGVLNACKSLREICLDKNNICTLSPTAFEGLSNLKNLTFGFNKLCNLEEGVFHGLRSLRKLDLSRNQLRILHKRTFDDLKSLEALSLFKNKLQCLPEEVFQASKSLRELNLSENQLHSIEKGTFHDLKSLEVLKLYDNKLQCLPPRVFQTLISLKSLNVSLNQLQSLDEKTFDDLTSLEELRLSNNKLWRLSAGLLQTLKSLKYLHLNHNQLRSLDKETFQDLESLRELDLRFNQVQSVEKGTFDDLRSLEELKFNNNKLQRLSVGLLQTLTSLRKLDLSHNQLQSLDEGTFDDLKSLEVFNLFNNKLQCLPVGIFQTLKSLRELYLGYNQLRSFDEGTFHDLKSLEYLELDENPLDYSQINPHTFDSLIEVELDPDLSIIQNRMRIAREEE
ncbi:hypothetical protein AAMO2058_001146300 [Amorphochlora amoebiformis]